MYIQTYMYDLEHSLFLFCWFGEDVSMDGIVCIHRLTAIHCI